MDQRDAAAARVLHRGELHLLAVDADAAAVRLVRAAEHLHQRALAGAVLSHHGQHLAARERERHAVERDHAREALADRGHREQLRRAARDFCRREAHCALRFISASFCLTSATLLLLITSTPVSTTPPAGSLAMVASGAVASSCIHWLAR